MKGGVKHKSKMTGCNSKDLVCDASGLLKIDKIINIIEKQRTNIKPCIFSLPKHYLIQIVPALNILLSYRV